MAAINRQIRLAARPAGLPTLSDFELAYSPMPSEVGGELLIRAIYLSLDPYMRGRMNDGASYARPLALGEVMVGGAVGCVVSSGDPSFRDGDVVEGMFGWQEYAVARGGAVRRIDPDLAPISTSLGVLGMPGLTALFGVRDVGQPRAGETVVVSGAAGAVGMIAGQIARMHECRVVGMAGTDAKTSWLLDELGFDAALNYRNGGVAAFESSLAAACPDGVDVYFDNVGGTTTDAVVQRLNVGARIALCGQISQYNLEAPELGPRWLGELIVRQARVEGFLVSAYAGRFGEGLEQLTRWLLAGKLKYREDVAQGIESAPQAFIGMLQGRNQGKQLVQLSET